MNIHEFQGKSLLRAYNVDIQEGFIAETPEQAVTVATQLKEKFGSDYFVIKAQIHAGGRGKGGGVKLAKSVEEAETITSKMIGMTLVTPQTGPEGKKVHKVLVAQDVYQYTSRQEQKQVYLYVFTRRRNVYRRGC
jgi:succinyl-CoA synthetase beta subunit